MSCDVSTAGDLRGFYNELGYSNYKTRVLEFISTTQSGNITDGYIADSFTAYQDELEKLGNAVLLTGGVDPRVTPYGTNLRPVSFMSDLVNAKHVLINGISFFAIDTTLIGSAYQNATANNTILTSLSSALSKYAYSGVYGGVMPSWASNFFRPKVTINGTNILDFDATTFGNYSNKGDLSQGVSLPYSVEPNHYLEYGIQQINITGCAVQLVKNGADTYAKRYPVICEIQLSYV